MKNQMKRLLALLMAAAIMLPAAGFSEELIPVPEVTVEPALAEPVAAADVDTSAAALTQTEESGASEAEPLETEPEVIEEEIAAISLENPASFAAQPNSMEKIYMLLAEYDMELDYLLEALGKTEDELLEMDPDAVEEYIVWLHGLSMSKPTAEPDDNTVTMEELAAMTGLSEDYLKSVLDMLGIEAGSMTESQAAEIMEMIAAGVLPAPDSTPNPTAEPEDKTVTMEELTAMTGLSEDYLKSVLDMLGIEAGALTESQAAEIMEMIAAGVLPTPQPTPTPLPTPAPTPNAEATVAPTAAPVETPVQQLAGKYGITVSQMAKMFDMSVSELNSLSAESLAECAAMLEALAEEYDSVSELAQDMGFSTKDLADMTGMTEAQLSAMTPIQVMALIVDITYEPTYRFQTIYDLANWYGLSIQEIGDLLDEFAPNLVYKTPAELEEMDAELRAMGVKPNLSIKTAQQLADKYGMTVSALAKELGMSVSDLEKLSPEAITELDAALKDAGFEAKVEFATAPEVAEKNGLTLNQISILTGYTMEELTSMTPDRLKELDAQLQNRAEPVFQNVDQLAKWFSISTDELEKRTNVSYYEMVLMTPAQLYELYEYLVSIEDSENIDGFRIENGVLVKYTGESGNVVIPENVTVIGEGAFAETPVCTVKLHKNIKTIESRAFYGCGYLTEIYIPDSVTSIGAEAFYRCNNLLSARLPAGLTDIANGLFQYCFKLRQVVIPSGVTSIGDNAFTSANLTSVILPATLKTIGIQAFSGNLELNGINLPDGLKTIAAEAFRGCKLKEIVVPNSVTEIGKAAFAINELEYCVLPSNMTKLPDYLFQSNDNLEMVTLPHNLQIVGEGAFSNCTGLTYMELPDTVTRIESAAFWGCTSLEYVDIPAGVTYIHDDAFSFCDHYKLVLLIPKEKKFIDYCTKHEFMYYYNDRVSYIEYDPNKVSLMAGEEYEPTMYVDFDDVDTITYSSSNKKVATVDSDGVITAKAAGTAKITAKSKKGGASATITVTVKTAPSAVKLDKSYAEVAVGSSLTLKAAVPAGSMTQYSWTSSNNAVAAVDENGTVYAISLGETVITVKTLNGKTASCKIAVRTAPTALHLDEAATMGVGQTAALKPVIEPEYAFQGMTYVSSDSGVVQVSADGKLTAKAAGTAVITATTSNGISKQMTVTVFAAPTKITLNVTSVTMGIGQTGQLTVKTSPESAYGKAAFASSNANVVSVDRDGNVTAHKTGSATITVKTYNGKQATCKITVQKAPSSISLSADALTLGVGEERKLTATLPKKTATSVGWTSSDESVVKVEKGTITPVGIGTATITAATHNGKSDTCAITVKAAPTSVKLSDESITLSVKQKGKLGVTLLNGESTDCAGKYTFTSSNAKVVTVSASGELTAVKAGKATIKVRTYDENVYAECAVTVVPLPSKVKLDKTSATLGAGETMQLTPSLTPAGSITSYTFTSSKSSVAKVDQNGLITAVKPGSATITVKTHNGKKATCKITVKAAPTTLMLNAESMVLGVGQTGKLSASVNADAASAFKVSVSDESIVSRSGTTLTAKAPGTAVITVETFNGLKKTCTVTVKPAPTRLVIQPETLVLSVGQTSGLNVEMLADGSADCAGGLTYSSSAEKVVTVSASGKLTAKRAGTATITVRSHNADVYAKCTVRVVAAPKSVTLNKTAAKLSVGETMQLIPAVSPASTPANFTFTSSKPSVVIVDKEGSLTAIGSGTATITVKTHNGKKATCKVTVTAD